MSEKEKHRFEHPVSFSGMFPEDSHIFETAEDLLEWAEGELEAWQWLSDTDVPKSKFAAEFIDHFIDFRNAANRYLQSSDPDEHRRGWDQITNRIQQWRAEKRFSSASRFGQFVLQLAKQSPETAGAGIHFMSRRTADLHPNHQSLGGAVVATFYLGVLPENMLKADSASYQKIGENWSKFYAQVSSEWQGRVIDCDKRLTSIPKAIEDFEKLHDKMREDTEDSLQRFETMCMEKIALLAPVDYWTNQHKFHNEKSSLLFWVWLGWAALLVLIVAIAVINLSIVQSDRIWRSAIFFAVVGLVAWPLRIITKIWMSHIHLATDARERATMIQTYLSMLEAGSVSPEQRELILPALFKSSSTGIVHDDGGPSVHVDMVNRMMGNN